MDPIRIRATTDPRDEDMQVIDRGICRSHLCTASFQSLRFYEKCGYPVFGKLDDMPGGETLPDQDQGKGISSPVHTRLFSGSPTVLISVEIITFYRRISFYLRTSAYPSV